MSKNKISKIEGLEVQVNLEELNLAYNSIESIEGLDLLSQLTVLNLSYNKINDIKELRKLNKNKKLRSLLLEGNPVTSVK